ncbi:hypothetical protein CRYUN_Cryun23aG0081300 [Craigia yunnanensis]
MILHMILFFHELNTSSLLNQWHLGGVKCRYTLMTSVSHHDSISFINCILGLKLFFRESC